MSKLPTFVEEEALVDKGYQLIAGVDEVGRGPLAGPVVAAAVILPIPFNSPWQNLVKDSKQLSPKSREDLFYCIYEKAISVGIGAISSSMIDQHGIVKATKIAMKLAIEQLSPGPEFLLIDYLNIPELSLPQNGITHGDTLCFSIACASIIAKVTRDRMMVKMDKEYPGYGMAQHKGYGTKEHIACLYRLGLSPIHRRSFRWSCSFININEED